jgi:hypothetical protein
VYPQRAVQLPPDADALPPSNANVRASPPLN